jgi:hypothetical protein
VWQEDTDPFERLSLTGEKVFDTSKAEMNQMAKMGNLRQ